MAYQPAEEGQGLILDRVFANIGSNSLYIKQHRDYKFKITKTLFT